MSKQTYPLWVSNLSNLPANPLSDVVTVPRASDFKVWMTSIWAFQRRRPPTQPQLCLFTHPSTTRDMEVAVSMCGLWGMGASRVSLVGHILLHLDDLWLGYPQLPSIRNSVLCQTLTK